MDQPAWIARAWAELGQREVSGRASNARVVAYYRDAGHPAIADDETAWCAAFVSAMLERSDVTSAKSLRARAYLDWGAAIDEARLGAVAVLKRGRSTALGHVGFVVGASDDRLFLLGGNQGNAVTVAAFPLTSLLGFRWPANEAAPAAGSLAPADDDGGFDAALVHVLAMEGGFTDDPHDPGGPTNNGITLADYARWTGRDAAGPARDVMVAELKAIPDDTVRAIYFKRYWQPAMCAALPPALAFFHFDAAVNQGLGTACRLMQEALGVEVDGEIGPQTLGAVEAADTGEVIDRYADIRRQRYRALKTFWRFGRGWLARVDATRAAARALIPIGNTGDKDMTAADGTETGTKWWGHSMTIWGALITAMATVVPALGPIVGLDITGDLVRQAGEQLVGSVQAVGGLIGTMLTIWGRMRASQPLERRDMRLKI